MVQWLKLYVPNAAGPGLIPYAATKDPAYCNEDQRSCVLRLTPGNPNKLTHSKCSHQPPVEISFIAFSASSHHLIPPEDTSHAQCEGCLFDRPFPLDTCFLLDLTYCSPCTRHIFHCCKSPIYQFFTSFKTSAKAASVFVYFRPISL